MDSECDIKDSAAVYFSLFFKENVENSRKELII